MHTLGRSYGYDILQLAIGLDWVSRVSFFTVLFPLMVWIILISRVAPVAPKRVQRATIAILLLANCTLLSALGSAAPVRGSGHWEAFQRWLHEARRADFPRGSGAALPVLLPSGEVWATLACTREERSIACRVEQGSHHNKVYTLPVASSARS